MSWQPMRASTAHCATSAGDSTVEWRVITFEHGEKRLTLDWIETWVATRTAPNASDARVETPATATVASSIERVLPHSLGAITRYELNETSVRCTIDVPLNRARRATVNDPAQPGLLVALRKPTTSNTRPSSRSR